ncbi:MAG: hypothetical protein AB8B51_01350 [Sedimentitalea sp.]
MQTFEPAVDMSACGVNGHARVLLLDDGTDLPFGVLVMILGECVKQDGAVSRLVAQLCEQTKGLAATSVGQDAESLPKQRLTKV